MYVACLGVDTNDQISNRLIIYIRSRFASRPIQDERRNSFDVLNQ